MGRYSKINTGSSGHGGDTRPGQTVKNPKDLSPCVVYYESRKRELKIRLMNEGRCDERVKARVEDPHDLC